MDTTTLLIIILIILLVGGGGFYGRGRWCRQEKAPARTGALAMLWFHVARDLPAIGARVTQSRLSQFLWSDSQ